MNCGICHAPGHNRASCPTRSEAELQAERDRKRYHRRPTADVLSALLSVKGKPSLSKVGKALGVSTERARQLMEKQGLTTVRLALKEAATPTPFAARRKKDAASHESKKKSRARWRKEGKCVAGGCERDDGHLRCSKCRKKLSGYQKKLQDERRAMGKCPRCGGLPDGETINCRTCLDYMNGTQRGCRSGSGEHPST